MRNNHEIDYRIIGEEMQYVEVELDPQETAIAEAGAFMMMDDGIQMETIFGDGSQQQGGSFMEKYFHHLKKHTGMRSNHEIDYRIYGEEMQYVEVELDPQETAIAEAGDGGFLGIE